MLYLTFNIKENIYRTLNIYFYITKLMKVVHVEQFKGRV